MIPHRHSLFIHTDEFLDLSRVTAEELSFCHHNISELTPFSPDYITVGWLKLQFQVAESGFYENAAGRLGFSPEKRAGTVTQLVP